MNEDEGMMVSGVEVPQSAYSKYPIWTAKKSVRKQARRMEEVIVFCTLALLGGALLSVVLVARVDYFYPYMFFLIVSFFAWQRYFHGRGRTSKRRPSMMTMSVEDYIGQSAGIKIGPASQKH